jgi:hypothetical protein
MDTTRQAGGSPAERAARNDAIFRDANEEIRGAARDWNMEGLLPALCECADLTCTQVVQLTPEEYDQVRAESRWFLTVVGHEGKAEPWGRVVAEHDRYAVVEKLGEAGETAERLDPRRGASG